MRRVTIIVLDSVGVGALPDADAFGDTDSDTLGHIASALGGLSLPNLERLGLGCLHQIQGINCPTRPLAAYGRMAEQSIGKDTTVGHWEMVGAISSRPFPTYPHGFPADLIAEFERRIGRKVLGNKPASGTEIIAELGDEHARTGNPIVYTSADSVFQIAAHENVIPIDDLYCICQIARDLLQGKNAVARVIARPFEGETGHFVRTVRRKDFGLEPPRPTLLDLAQEAGVPVIGIGKIGDIFAHRSINEELHTTGNANGLDVLAECLDSRREGLLFANLVDFDMLYGHRNDVRGYALALQQFDARLPDLLAKLDDGDAMFITADHGCDPTTASTDHSREYVPLLVYGPALKAGKNLGVCRSFADLGATVAELLSLAPLPVGTSFTAALR